MVEGRLSMNYQVEKQILQKIFAQRALNRTVLSIENHYLSCSILDMITLQLDKSIEAPWSKGTTQATILPSSPSQILGMLACNPRDPGRNIQD